MLPRGRTVLQVREESLASPALRDFLARLRAAGYLVAVHDFTGRAADLETSGVVDILAVDMQRPDRDALFMQALKLKQVRGHEVLAKKVEDAATFNAARDAGCDLFQGFFFQKPEQISSRTMSTALAGSLGILRLVEQPDPDIGQLARSIQKDVSLSFRLLKFLNSPYFGFTREVSSIKLALILAGWQQMRTWLRLVLITDMTPKGKPSELAFLSAQRGRFLELTAIRAGARARRDAAWTRSACCCSACSRSWTASSTWRWPTSWVRCRWTRSSRIPCARGPRPCCPGSSWCTASSAPTGTTCPRASPNSAWILWRLRPATRNPCSGPHGIFSFLN